MTGWRRRAARSVGAGLVACFAGGPVVLASTASAAAWQAASPAPSSPRVVEPPSWSRVLQMPDGRTFVTDGGLSIDAALVKPVRLPSTVLAPESAKVLAAYFSAPFDREFGLRDLTPGQRPNTFATPTGIHLNGNYVAVLRETLPDRARLRTRGATDPVVAVVDGIGLAVLMPLAPPRP